MNKMTNAITLKATIRTEIGKKADKLRKQDLIPAVMYGNKIAAENISVNYNEFKKVYSKAGESALVQLEVEGKKLNVLIHDIQLAPMSGKVTHIDFFQVNMKEEVETEIPLEFVGEAPAVKALGGVLIKNMDEISVKCLPSDLPEKYEIDISVLATFDDVISVKDLKISDKVEILLDGETVIALVSAPRTEESLSELDTKVEEDVSKVAGVVKEEAAPVEKK
ncbi:MAG: 50S ribosomal protein L25/general stress protein Ctc, large subunit ribosomal protein L25 [Parcubacteria group bacterium GW2011_GWC1_36_108]|nr:MAG: 50S ribosomal protein L25/general stress protein Ctc, large subunit ribosomal protein L25 [Parcubacteria group bacterium GW2011_GWC1_36_108]